jgi:hypothetical protein
MPEEWPGSAELSRNAYGRGYRSCAEFRSSRLSHEGSLTKRHRLIRTDGTEQILGHRPSLDEIRRLNGCECMDTVTINRMRQTVMFVDDTGMIDGKPVNPKATALYHAICKPSTIHQIHGNVVILDDRGQP